MQNMLNFTKIIIMKTTKENYKKLCEVVYNFTGNVYWVNKSIYDAAMKENFFVCFAAVKKEVEKRVKDGEIFRFPLIKLETGTEKPYIYNNLIFK